jgi:ABC-type spermidine/putrescine transport system permease subunit I
MTDASGTERGRAATGGAGPGTAARARWRSSTALLLAPALLWVTFAVLVPIALVMVVGLWRLDGLQLVQAWDLSAYRAVLTDPTFWGIARWTLQVWGTVLVLVFLLGVPAAYYLTRYVRSPRMQTAVLMLAVLPFWVSYVIRIITWIPLFGNRGVLNQGLMTLGLIDAPSPAFLYNAPAMIIALTSLYVVFIVGPTYFALSRIDEDTVAASRMSGASPWQTFWKVELPLAKPGMVAGAFFATVFLLGDFATEQIVGGGNNPMLAGLSQRYTSSLQWPVAAAVATMLLVVALGLIWLLTRVHDLRREV